MRHRQWKAAADHGADALAMLATFVTAVLVVTAAVALLAFVPTWWMLLIALGVHAVGTVVVYLLILLVVTDPPDAASSGERPAAGPGSHVRSPISIRRWTGEWLRHSRRAERS